MSVPRCLDWRLPESASHHGRDQKSPGRPDHQPVQLQRSRCRRRVVWRGAGCLELGGTQLSQRLLRQNRVSPFMHVPVGSVYLTLRKIAIWMSKMAKNLTFSPKKNWQKLSYFPKNCHRQFFWKNWKFFAIFFWKNVKFLAIFWQSNGNFPEGQVWGLLGIGAKTDRISI